jgi:hypothetical protein
VDEQRLLSRLGLTENENLRYVREREVLGPLGETSQSAVCTGVHWSQPPQPLWPGCSREKRNAGAALATPRRQAG